MKNAIRSPGNVVSFEDEVMEHTREIGHGHPLTDPVVLHLFSRIGPDLKVVRQQKDIGDTLSEGGQNPFLEVRRFVLAVLLNLNQAVQTANDLFPRQPVEIVLERIWNKPIPDPDPGFAFMSQPILLRNELMHQRIEIFVVRKLDVTADVPEESFFIAKRRGQTAGVVVRLQQLPIGMAELVKTPGGAEPSGAATKYKN